MFKRTKVSAGVLLALGGVVAATSLPAYAQQAQAEAQRIEVTGSRIKRVDAEGSLPITTITREELEASGTTTVAEFMRTVTFASAGNFRPQSGSSAQSFAGVDLRGLGSSRTLVLIDGRRLPKAPNVGDSVDLNSVPMAAIERIEILTDGASAVYGSDAIGGVVNFITRKDFEGAQLTVGYTDPDSKGGSKEEVSGIFGIVSDKGRMLGGFSHTARGMVYTRQRPWGQRPGNSTYGNNYISLDGVHKDANGNPILVPVDTDRDGRHDALGNFNSPIAIPNACNDPNFSIVPATIRSNNPDFAFVPFTFDVCRYNFNAVAADEASTDNQSVFVRGEYMINDDWQLYSNASFSRLGSFGRYAPAPSSPFLGRGYIVVDASSPNNPTNPNSPVYLNNGQDATAIGVYHRFAAGGNRDGQVENTVANAMVGAQGRVADMLDVDVGVAFTRSKYIETGRGYVVASAALDKINSGAYDLINPAGNPQSTLQSFTATIGRDGIWNQREVYGTAGFDLMKLGGGTAQMLVGAEWRKEEYADIYDSLSEAGEIVGSAGNSAGGDRRVTSFMAEALFPFTRDFEAQLAARYERYSDYGSDFSPKASFRWKLTPALALRGSVGTGFRAPSLPIVTQKTSFSAESVRDAASCAALVGNAGASCQVSTYISANPDLQSEKSKQFAFGLVADPTNWLSVKADYWNIKITDSISYISAQDVVNRVAGTDPLPLPASMGVQRDGAGVIQRVDTGYGNEGTLQTSGIDLNAVTRFDLGSWGRISQNYTYSQVLEYKVDGTDIIGNIGSPKARAVLGHTWSRGPFEVTWNINYIGKQGEADYYGDGEYIRVGSYVTHDIQANWTTPLKGATLTIGVLNVGDKLPQLVDYDGRNFNFYLYDSYGVQPYIRFTQKF